MVDRQESGRNPKPILGNTPDFLGRWAPMSAIHPPPADAQWPLRIWLPYEHMCVNCNSFLKWVGNGENKFSIPGTSKMTQKCHVSYLTCISSCLILFMLQTNLFILYAGGDKVHIFLEGLRICGEFSSKCSYLQLAPINLHSLGNVLVPLAKAHSARSPQQTKHRSAPVGGDDARDPAEREEQGPAHRRRKQHRGFLAA